METNVILGGLAALLVESKRWITLFESGDALPASDLTNGAKVGFWVVRTVYTFAAVIAGGMLGGYAVPDLAGVKDALSAFLLGATPTVLVSLAPGIIGRVLNLPREDHIVAVGAAEMQQLSPSVKEALGSNSGDGDATVFRISRSESPFFSALFRFK